jgi:hypothetical protein
MSSYTASLIKLLEEQKNERDILAENDNGYYFILNKVKGEKDKYAFVLGGEDFYYRSYHTYTGHFVLDDNKVITSSSVKSETGGVELNIDQIMQKIF